MTEAAVAPPGPAYPSRPLTVVHVAGSPESAFFDELSRVYAADCLRALRGNGSVHHVVHIAPDGTWRFPDDLDERALADVEPLDVGAGIARLSALAPDVAVPQLFCRPGLTHHRGLLAVLGIPSVGNPPEVMGLTADKVRTRAVVAAAGVRVPEAEVVAPGGRSTLAPPVVVKPVDGDNSVGLTLARDHGALDAALAVAWRSGGAALVERYVPLGREVRVGTIVRDGELLVLPLEQYALDATHPVRVAADKIDRDAAGRMRLAAKRPDRSWIVPADDPAVPRVAELARLAHRALGCAHHGLFDVRIDPHGEPWFLEAGPYCSFAPSSVVSTMAAAAGIPLTTLFAEAVAYALAPVDITTSP